MIQNVLGSPVQGDNFFGRAREEEQLWAALETDHVLLPAPRRVGKTSLMLRLKATAEQHRYQCIYVSAARVDSEGDLIHQLCKEIFTVSAGEKAIEWLMETPVGQFLKRVKKVGLAGASLELGEGGRAQWAELGDALAAALARLPGRWLVMIDELPLLILSLLKQDPTVTRPRRFLNWFRDIRQTSSTHIRWVLAGSIGLDTVTARLNLGDTINDLRTMPLGPFTDEVADRFLRDLAASYQMTLSAEVRRHLCVRVGWLIPYHLHLLFATLRSHCNGRTLEPTTALVDEAYATLLEPSHKSYFDYWRQRLKEQLGNPDDRFAISLLSAAAKDDDGASRSTLAQVLGRHFSDPDERDDRLRYLIDVLENDGYLVAHNDRLRFRSALLRDFWRRRMMA